MKGEYQLEFLRDILKKSHIRTFLSSALDSVDSLLDSQISAIVGVLPMQSIPIKRILGKIEKNTQYRFSNELKFQYIMLPLSEKNLFFIGPFLSSPLTSGQIWALGEEFALSPGSQKLFKEYYSSLPIVPENDRLFTVIDSFCELIWQTPTFSTVEIKGSHTFSYSSEEFSPEGGAHTLAKMEMMEKRYGFENEMILAVKLGQEQKSKLLLSAVGEQMFEKRLQDSVRNAKNYCIIMNTLLRKAAEEGGVHPLYIDQVSSDFATKIERISDLSAVSALMDEMFRAYCKLVRKHSTAKFSPIVKKAILLIDADLSIELSLGRIAKELGISAGYLATIFKKETGKTISEAIRQKRIALALHLLNTTGLQIQTIAMHCGIMDVQYFSKIFKKEVGKTPKEYRDSIRN